MNNSSSMVDMVGFPKFSAKIETNLWGFTLPNSFKQLFHNLFNKGIQKILFLLLAKLSIRKFLDRRREEYSFHILWPHWYFNFRYSR